MFKYLVVMALLIQLSLSIADEAKDPTRPTLTQKATTSSDEKNADTAIEPAIKPLRLYQIIQSKQGHKAIINGQIVATDDKVQNYTVKKIDAYAVSLENNDDQQILVLPLFNQQQPDTPAAPKNTAAPITTPAPSASLPTTDTTSSPSLTPEAAILNKLLNSNTIQQINVDELIKPLQGSQP